MIIVLIYTIETKLTQVVDLIHVYFFCLSMLFPLEIDRIFQKTFQVLHTVSVEVRLANL